MRTSFFLGLATALSTTTTAQVYQGFNYGSVFTNNAPITQQDYENQFNTAKQLQGTSGFTSARLFTTVQAGTTNSPSQAFPAAIATKTQLLLGIFLSSTDEAFNNEVAALRSAISQYGRALADLVIGISVGSEDLYRISPIGIENLSNPGEGPDAVVSRINAVRSTITGTALGGKPVGHVDTWTAYVNSSNSAVIDASDFIGTDAYPYFQNTQANSIENGESLFFEAYNATVAVSKGKPVWITETGWPVSGPTENQAVPSLANAKTYWDQVGCRVFGQVTTFWYTLQDAFPNTPSPSFGVVGSTLSTTPLYDLSCPGDSSSSSSAGSSSASSAAISSRALDSSSAPEVSTTGSGSQSTIPSVTPAIPNTVPTVETVMTYTAATTFPVTYTSGTDTLTSVTTSAAVVTSTHASTFATVTTTPSHPAPSSPAGSCSADLSGDFEFPHLIVPVDKNQPDTPLNTGFNGHFSPTVSTIFNFDFPPSYVGRTCSLIFLFPQRESLQTSNYTISGTGGIQVDRLLAPADSATTYNNQPGVNATVDAVPELQAGNSYVLGSGNCFVNRRIGYKVSATGSLDLNYFQDFNPEAIGLYVSVC
ncbi:MAG: hypothetical protein L6R41_002750 [Letrouitia leprolyta]|nr:MAG: hypothetical protein L6R41_002750 [Letrouitia leprolyta]